MPSPLVRVGDSAQKVLDLLSKRDGRPKGTIIEEGLQLYFQKYPKAREALPSKRGRPPKQKEPPD